MTEQETIDYIKTHECGDYNCNLPDNKIDDYGHYGDSEECKDCMYYTIIKALEKQIPYTLKEYPKYEGQCKCGSIFLDRYTSYCGNCGQKLDWSKAKMTEQEGDVK